MSARAGVNGEERIRATLRGAAAVDLELDLEAAGARLARRAEAEGLVEVAYAEADSPIGPLLLAATAEGLVAVGWASSDRDRILDELAVAIGPRVVEAPARLDGIRAELEHYFAGRLRRFETPIDWRLSSGFRRSVLSETTRIPYGETRSYAEVATLAGSPRAFRAAGSALGANPIPIVVPCHRVLRRDGGLGGYGGGLDVKRHLLRLEGTLG